MLTSLRPGAGRGRRRRAVPLIAGATLVASAVGGQLVARAVTGPAPKAQVAITASASASGLFPGATRPLTVTLKNQSARAVTVTGVRVRVMADPRRPTCLPTDHVTPSASSRTVRLAAGRRRTLTLEITMSEAAPDSCQGGSFPLAISVRTP